MIIEKAEPEGVDADKIEIEFEKPEKVEAEAPEKEEKEEEPKAEARSDEDDAEEEISKYSKNVQNRIKKLTTKYHTERRQREALVTEMEEQGRITRSTVEELNRLKDLLSRGEHVMIGEAKGRLESEIQLAKQHLKSALDLGETDKIAEAQAFLSKVMAQRERVQAYQPQALPKTQLPQRPVVDVRAREWQEENKWFGRDTEMTHYAMGLHKKLTEQDGVRPDSDEYYTEINANVRKRFSDRFPRSNGHDEDRQSAVASVTRAAGKTRKVTLSESQVRIAKRLGLTNEQYAGELLKTQS